MLASQKTKITELFKNALAAVGAPENTKIVLERPKQQSHGDIACTVALQCAKAMKQPPRVIAEKLVEQLRKETADSEMFSAIEIAGPGFINLKLAPSLKQDVVREILKEGPAYGCSDAHTGESILLEYVSANPTGPLHVGNGRGAAIGDALAAVLGAAGYEVSREYYVNDAGTQADTFTDTLYARYQQLFGRNVEIPKDGYPGDYMIDLAKALRDRASDGYLRPEGEAAPKELGPAGIELMLQSIRAALDSFGVHYDTWYSERSLYESGGAYDTAMRILREKGLLADREGALWFSSSELGEDKDNVVVRSDGHPTYYASDIAYHWDKFIRRGYDLVVDVWGADHHGHVSRLKTATGAVGADPEALHILLYQLVFLKRSGEAVKLSKRAGELVTLSELIADVGADAAKFFFLLRSPGAQMDFDLDLAVKQSSENPVFYVQYAHARLCSILERAREQGITPDGGDVSLLTQPAELALVREMMRLTDVIEVVASSLEPQQLPHYAMSLANAFHAFNDSFKQANDPSLKVITEDVALSEARLRLVLAARIALARVLGLMGMSAPERM